MATLQRPRLDGRVGRHPAAAIMGPFRIHDGVRLMGWLTTAVMAVAAIIMCVTTVF
jgi:hypothetical protein